MYRSEQAISNQYTGGFGSANLTASEAAEYSLIQELFYGDLASNSQNEAHRTIRPQLNPIADLIKSFMSPQSEGTLRILFLILLPFILFPFYLFSKKLGLPGIYNKESTSIPKILIISLGIFFLLALSQILLELNFNLRYAGFLSIFIAIIFYLGIITYHVILTFFAFITLKLFEKKFPRNKILWILAVIGAIIPNIFISIWKDIPLFEYYSFMDILYSVLLFTLEVIIARKFLNSGLIVAFPLLLLYILIKLTVNYLLAL